MIAELQASKKMKHRTPLPIEGKKKQLVPYLIVSKQPTYLNLCFVICVYPHISFSDDYRRI